MKHVPIINTIEHRRMQISRKRTRKTERESKDLKNGEMHGVVPEKAGNTFDERPSDSRNSKVSPYSDDSLLLTVDLRNKKRVPRPVHQEHEKKMKGKEGGKSVTHSAFGFKCVSWILCFSIWLLTPEAGITTTKSAASGWPI